MATEQWVFQRLHAHITVEIWRRTSRQKRSCWAAAELLPDILQGERGLGKDPLPWVGSCPASLFVCPYWSSVLLPAPGSALALLSSLCWSTCHVHRVLIPAWAVARFGSRLSLVCSLPIASLSPWFSGCHSCASGWPAGDPAHAFVPSALLGAGPIGRLSFALPPSVARLRGAWRAHARLAWLIAHLCSLFRLDVSSSAVLEVSRSISLRGDTLRQLASQLAALAYHVPGNQNLPKNMIAQTRRRKQR